MAFTTITKPAVGDPTKKTAFADAVINNLTDLNSRIGGGGSSSGIPNSSFEDDGDADGDPDSWTVTNHTPNASGIIATSGAQAHGLNAWKVDYPASAAQGATIQTNDYIAISPDEIIYLAWKMKGTSATGANHVVSLLWYTFDKSVISTTEIYSDPANPTEWTQCLSGAISPSTAKFMKIKIQGSDTTVPSGTGSISFDDVRLVNGPADVFDRSATFGNNVTPPSPLSTQAPSWVGPAMIGCAWIEAIGAGAGSLGANVQGGGGGAYSAGYFIYAASSAYSCDYGARLETPTAGHDATFNSSTIVAKGGSIGGVGVPGVGGLASAGTGEIKLNGGTAYGHIGGAGTRGGGGGSGGSGGGGTHCEAIWPGGGGGGDLYNGGTSFQSAGMVKVWWNE